MTEYRIVKPNEDPVCGMTVDVAQARTKGLTTTRDGHEYAFCGKGCLLEFRDDPETFLAADYSPSM
jgi:YHS domain-containing protein